MREKLFQYTFKWDWAIRSEKSKKVAQKKCDTSDSIVEEANLFSNTFSHFRCSNAPSYRSIRHSQPACLGWLISPAMNSPPLQDHPLKPVTLTCAVTQHTITMSWHDVAHLKVEQCLQHSPRGQESAPELSIGSPAKPCHRLCCEKCSCVINQHHQGKVQLARKHEYRKEAWVQRGSTKRNTDSEVVQMLPSCTSPQFHYVTQRWQRCYCSFYLPSTQLITRPCLSHASPFY